MTTASASTACVCCYGCARRGRDDPCGGAQAHRRRPDRVRRIWPRDSRRVPARDCLRSDQGCGHRLRARRRPRSGPRNITVNVLQPGIMPTDMGTAAGGNLPPAVMDAMAIRRIGFNPDRGFVPLDGDAEGTGPTGPDRGFVPLEGGAEGTRGCRRAPGCVRAARSLAKNGQTTHREWRASAIAARSERDRPDSDLNRPLHPMAAEPERRFR